MALKKRPIYLVAAIALLSSLCQSGLAQTAVTAAGPATAGGASGVDMASTIAKQCNGTASANGSILQDDPELCGQSRMLREGDNVYKVYLLYVQKKAQKVSQKIAAGQFSDLVAQRICTSTEAPGDCDARNKREALDAEVRARQNILDNGKGRADLLGGDGAPSAGIVGATQSNDKNTVLKDFVDDVTPNAKGLSKVQQMLASPQSVTYTDIGTAVVGPGAKMLQATKFDERSVNQSVDAGGGNGDLTHLEVDDGHTIDTAMNKVLTDVSTAYSKTAMQSDQNAYKAIATDLSKAKSKDVATTDVSVSAFNEALKDIASQADPNAAKTGNLSVINTQNVEVPVSDPNLYGSAPARRTPSGAGAATGTIDSAITSDACRLAGRTNCP